MSFKKAIVWGCDLHQHTNSYIYAGFHKAFKHMGFDAYWLNERSNVSGFDFSNSLFITEGQHDGNIPMRDDCKYVLHNCSSTKYESIKPENKLALQTYTYDADRRWGAKKIKDGSYFLDGGRCLFQPWATDLLPHEIDLAWASLPRSREFHWCGTMGGGRFGNEGEIMPFVEAAKRHGISFHYHGPGSTSFDDNKRLIQKSYLAPAIHGAWQAENGYISCRIFKNISYGHMGISNNLAAHTMLEEKTVYSADTSQLFHAGQARMNDVAAIKDLMALVRDKHTYINRIQAILSVI